MKKIKEQVSGGSLPANATGSPIAGTDSADPTNPIVKKRLRKIVPPLKRREIQKPVDPVGPH